ncbi:retrotransposable element Tf2 [Tanacetum coccineum]
MLVSAISSDAQQRIVDSWTNDTKIQALITKLQANGNDSGLQHDLIEYFHDGTMGCHLGVKANMAASPRLLQPLHIPQRVWSEISMDFIDGLPTTKGKTVILVVVDRLSKYSHFVPLSHPYTATQMAHDFLDNIYKLHGLPKVIVSDKDKVFLNKFWQELLKLLDVSLHMSTSYHPQTDGQTKVVNRCLEGFLRCMTGDINVDVVDRSLTAREEAISLLKFHLQRAQVRMKNMVDKKRSDTKFELNDWVYVKLQPYKQISMRKGKHHKLSPKFYGAYQIIARAHKGDNLNTEKTLSKVDDDVVISDKPQAALERKKVKKRDLKAEYVLVQWVNGSREDGT